MVKLGPGTVKGIGLNVSIGDRSFYCEHLVMVDVLRILVVQWFDYE